MLASITRDLILSSNEKMDTILAAVEKTLNIRLPLFVAYDYDDHYTYVEEDQVHMTEICGYEITFAPWSVIDGMPRYLLSCHPGPKLDYLLDAEYFDKKPNDITEEEYFNKDARNDIGASMALFLSDGTKMDRRVSTDDDRVMMESAREKDK